MEAAKEGKVALFLALADDRHDTTSERSRIERRARNIFCSQTTHLFGADDKEELQAALREATAIEKGATLGEIAEESATDKVQQLAANVRALHENSPDREYYVHQFIRAAYDMKCMFRSAEWRDE